MDPLKWGGTTSSTPLVPNRDWRFFCASGKPAAPGTGCRRDQAREATWIARSATGALPLPIASRALPRRAVSRVALSPRRPGIARRRRRNPILNTSINR